mgnify:CR=1 FL=1
MDHSNFQSLLCGRNGGGDGDIDNVASVTTEELPTPDTDDATVPVASGLWAAAGMARRAISPDAVAKRRSAWTRC